MSQAVLDVEHLRPLFDGESGELRALVDETVRTSAALVETLHAQVAAHGPDASKAAHELKGLARTVGAQELGLLAELAEKAAASAHWDDYAAAVGSMRAAHRRLSDAALALGDDIAKSE